MNLCPLFSVFRKGLVLAGMLLLAVPLCKAQGRKEAKGRDPEGSVAQAQATMSSLFGSKRTLPIPPRVDGTIALPSFDSKDLLVDEEWIRSQNASEKK